MDEHRRRLLALLGTAGVTHLAGCGSDDDSGTGGTDDLETTTEPPADGTDDLGTERETITPTATLTPTDTLPTETNTDSPGTPTETPQPTPPKLAPEDGDGFDESGSSVGDEFGFSAGVSDDGTTAVIGARFDEDPNGNQAGSAYVFQREGGEWIEETKLAPEDGDSVEQFGHSVEMSSDGTTAVIGAPQDEDPNGSGAGSAYVFQREGGEWIEETKLAASDGDSGDEFGWMVSVSGDGTTAVIGAPKHGNPNGEFAGSAYVFQRGSDAWSEETKLTPEDGDRRDQFGFSVEVSNDGTTAVIGAPQDEDPNGDAAGSAYVFQRGGDAWSEETKLTPEDGDDSDRFGWAVSVSGDGATAVIGAIADEDPNGDAAGSAYVFRRGSGAWSEETKLTPEDGDRGDQFGYSVVVSSDGTTAVIGAWNDEDPNGDAAGSAYVFQREDGAWSEEQKLAPEDGDSNDKFGWSVEVSSDGTTAVIGAYNDEDPNGPEAGSAYVFPVGE